MNQTIRGSFDDLPTVITQTAELGGEVRTVSLEYRVVETAVQFGNQEYTVQMQGGKYTVTTVAGEAPFAPVGPSGDGDNAHTNQLKTTSLTVEKVWVDDFDNLYGSRPHDGNPSADWSVTFLIQQSTNGTDWTSVQTRSAASADPQDLTVTLYGTNDASTAKTTIDNLPETDENGSVLQYRAIELKPDAELDGNYGNGDWIEANGIFNGTYEVTYANNNAANGYATTATNTLQSTQIAAEKRWNLGMEEEAEKTSVRLHLEYLNQNGEWVDVLDSRDGKECDVVVSANGEPLAEGQAYGTNGPWKAIWTGLPKVLPGSKLDEKGETQYCVTESVPNGYQQEGTSIEEGTYIFTNVIETSYTVKKSWHVYHTSVIQSVQVQLYRTTDETTESGTSVGTEVWLNEGNNWSHTFTDLPKYEEGTGKKYTYYVLETTTSDGWEVHYEHSSETNTTTIRNVGKVTVSGTKTWHDNNDAYHTRPDSITLQLYCTTDTGENKQWVKVDSEQVQAPWTYEFTGLPYADENGKPYTYRVAEMNGDAEIAEGGTLPAVVGDPEPTYPKADYTVGYDGKDYKWNITNTLTDEIDIAVTKHWIDGGQGAGERPESLTFELLQNGTVIGTQVVNYTIASRIMDFFTAGETLWTCTFENLPRFDANGVAYEYTVREVSVPGYETGPIHAIDPNHPELGFVLTNTKLTQLTVEKVWHGTEAETMPASVTVQLKYYTTDPNVRYNVPGNMQSTADLNAGNSWKYTFTNLPQYVEVDGKYVRCTYVAEEIFIGGDAVGEADFTVHYTDATVKEDPNFHGQATYRTTIVNVQNMEITGTKTWVDNGNAYGTRPENLTLTLYRSVAGGKEEVVNATPTWTKPADDNVWTYTYSRLPKTDKEGKPYTYRVEETLPAAAENGDHYERLPEETGYDFTNVLTGTVDIPVTKTWVDNHDGWGERPETVTIRLYRHTEAKPEKQLVEERTFTTDAGALEKLWNAITGQTDDEWICTFAGLPKYDDTGARYIYTVEETVPEDYEAAYDQEQFEITNTRDGDLRVEKEVTGSDGQKNREFHFTVTLSGTSVTGIQAETITGEYGDMTFTNGVAEFTLKHGVQKLAEDLPAGLMYTVVETDANTNRYRTTYTGETGTIPAGDTAVTHVENRRNRQYYPDYTEEPEPTPPRIPEESWRPPHYDDWHDVPRTGDTMNLALYVALAVVSAAGLTTLLILMRRKRR